MRILLGEQICISHQQGRHGLFERSCRCVGATTGPTRSLLYQLEGFLGFFHLLGKLLQNTRAFLSAYLFTCDFWVVYFAALSYT